MVRDAIFWKVVSGELPASPAAILLGWTFIDYDEHAQRVHVAFNAAVPGRILGWGQIEHSKGSIAFTSGWLTDESGKVLARATATFRVGNLRWKGLAIPRGLARHMVTRRLRAARTA